jgi:hypothetical protein
VCGHSGRCAAPCMLDLCRCFLQLFPDELLPLGQAFLGPEEAEEFVSWLWELLESVENKTLDLGSSVPASAAVVAPDVSKRDARRSRSPARRDERRRSRSRDRQPAHTRSRSRERSLGRGADWRRYDNDTRGRGGRGEDFRRRDADDTRDRGYARGGRHGYQDFEAVEERRSLREVSEGPCARSLRACPFLQQRGFQSALACR